MLALRMVFLSEATVFYLDKVTNDVFFVAWQHVDNGNLNHGVGSWLLFECGTTHVDQYLCGKCWVVDLHVELKELVVGLA